MGRKSSLTPERLAKDINFFEGYVAKCEIEFALLDNILLEDFASKYQQEDVIFDAILVNNYTVTFNIYSNGQKQLRSLINIIGEDLNVIECDLISLEEC
jgi:hypothetical protein|tara:strand:+ start:156 stop:452 length:297 start_codon:yes stop_codon:yes gene_type:complete